MQCNASRPMYIFYSNWKAWSQSNSSGLIRAELRKEESEQKRAKAGHFLSISFLAYQAAGGAGCSHCHCVRPAVWAAVWAADTRPTLQPAQPAPAHWRSFIHSLRNEPKIFLKEDSLILAIDLDQSIMNNEIEEGRWTTFWALPH